MRTTTWRTAVAAVRAGFALCLVATAARAHGPMDEPGTLPEVVVESRQPVSAASSDDIAAETFALRPHATLQEILNNVPGLVVRQHQGGGKATQYLIRGFNADHGTDFLVTVDGLPVNLRSHAHGQGYADLNFVIPETIETLRLRKGPYFADLGDFGTAGALDLVTKSDFVEDFALAEGGAFDRMRFIAGVSPRLGGVQTLLATQAYFSDGPFVHPERFARYNAFGKLTLAPHADAALSLAGVFYQADWDASGQIPQRLVSAGVLDRFGAIDPTEGGRTGRENVDLHYEWTPTAADTVSFQGWASRYELRLWSNFTFFQDTIFPDPQGTTPRFWEGPGGRVRDAFRTGPPPPGAAAVPGDGIEQNDARWLHGFRGGWERRFELLALPLATEIAAETRADDADVAVHRQVRRTRFFTVSRTRVVERSYGAWWRQDAVFTDWLRFEGGLRGDWFTFDVADRLPRQRRDPSFTAVPLSGYADDGIVGPKANLVVTPEPRTDVYLNFGRGFHSNDARAVVQAARAGDDRFRPLVPALGYEVGARTRRLDDRLDVAAALWLLDLESEIVFCGDCGFIEREGGAGTSFAASGATRRWGIDFETRLRLTDWLVADYDLAWADPRFENGGAIPIAPTLFMNGGLTAAWRNGFSVALRVRYLDDRPADERRTIPARGYLLADVFLEYRWRNVDVGLDLLNLGDFDWQEAVFADTSCTAREVRTGRCGNPAGPVEDVHFTPGDPFAVRGRLIVWF
jgi:outer membrane receptor protein involved in Fe transport